MKKYIPLIIGLVIFAALITSALKNSNKKDASIKLHHFETVAKVTRFNLTRSSSNYYYIYYYEDKKYNESGDIDYQNGEKCIGKYYTVSLSTENPKFSEIHLDEEVTDSLQIRRAGFII